MGPTEKHNAGLLLAPLFVPECQTGVMLLPQCVFAVVGPGFTSPVLPLGLCVCDGDIRPKPAHLATGWPLRAQGCTLSSLSSPSPKYFLLESGGSYLGCVAHHHCPPGRLLRAILNRPNSLHCDGKAHRRQASVYCRCPFVYLWALMVHLVQTFYNAVQTEYPQQ